MLQNKRLQKLQMAVAALVLSVLCLLPAVQANAATVATPTGVKQTAGTATGIQFGWNPVAGATQYGCSYSADGNNWSNEVLTTSTLQVFNGLAASKTYYVRVRAYNGGWGAYSASLAVVTAPKACSTVKETAATTNSFTIAWNAVEGVSGYNIWVGKGSEATKLVKTTASTTTALVIKGLSADTKYTVEVVPFMKSSAGFSACADAKRNKNVVTMAKTVKNVKLNAWNSSTGEISIKWTNKAKYEDGYEVQLLNTKGKKVKSFSVKGSTAKGITVQTTKLLSKGGKMRVRAYKELDGKKSYGDWSKEVVIVPTATATAQKISDSAVTVSWKKVKGAQGYTIYYSTQPNSGYTKLATVSSGTTSYTFQNLNKDTTYYVYVSANKVKIGKKRYSSTAVPTKSPVTVTVAEQTK